jgi:hypothetical protein
VAGKVVTEPHGRFLGLKRRGIRHALDQRRVSKRLVEKFVQRFGGRDSIQSKGEREATGRGGKEESRNVSTSQARWRRQFLFLFNLEAIGPNVDAHAFGLLAILIQLIPHYRDGNYQRAYD